MDKDVSLVLPQRVETDRALAADAVVDRELQLRAVAQHAVGARAPGLDDVPLLVAHRRPLHGELVAGLLHPPHVVAAGIDELHLQVVGWRIPAYFERESVVLRIVDRQVALDADVAGHAVEVVVQAQRLAVRAIRHAKLAADLVGGNDAPRGCVLEAVEKSWLADDLLGECGGRRKQDQHAQEYYNRHSRARKSKRLNSS